MRQFAEEGDLAQGGGWDAFVFDFEADALECDDFFGLSVACFVHDAVGSFS